VRVLLSLKDYDIISCIVYISIHVLLRKVISKCLALFNTPPCNTVGPLKIVYTAYCCESFRAE